MRAPPVKRWADEVDAVDPTARLAGEWSRAIAANPNPTLNAQTMMQVRAQLGMAPVPAGAVALLKATLPMALVFIALGAGAYHFLLRADPTVPLEPRVRPPSAGQTPAIVAVIHQPSSPAPCEIANLPKPKRATPRPAAKAVVPPAPLAVPPDETPTVSTADDDSLLEESRLLGTAIRLLRRELDAKGALTTLDGYFARFPTGKLERDARSVQLDALLSLDRKTEALEVFDTLSESDFKGMARGLELRLVHGELLLHEGRYAEAAVAFNGAVESPSLATDLVERALIGRGIARMHSGDREGGNADLARYLVRFPGGRFVQQAHAEMKVSDEAP